MPRREANQTVWVEISTSNSLSSIRIGFTDQLVAALAEARLVVGYWLRSGNTHCVNGAAEFLRHTLNSLPRHVAVGLVRADSGFSHASVLDELESRCMPYVMATRLTKPIQSICQHDDAAWEETDMEGMEVQEVEAEEVGRRILVLRQRIARRTEAGGKMLLDVPGYRFQALVTNLPRSMKPLTVWRRYNVSVRRTPWFPGAVSLVG
jgi:hypothetical protein